MKLEDAVRSALETYFHDLAGSSPHGLHQMVLDTVEKPMLELVLRHADGNQRLAAEWLGINRNTLRRKLLDHKLIK